jgi:hypothetical protein
MVNFGTKLKTNKNPQWEGKYVDYDALKAVIKKTAAAVRLIRRSSINAVAATPPEDSILEGDDSDEEQGKSGKVRDRSESADSSGKVVSLARRATVDASEGSALLLGSGKKKLRSTTGGYGTGGGDGGSGSGGREDHLVDLLILSNSPDDEFVSLVKSEASKVDSFYLDQIAELRERYTRLRVTISRMKSNVLSLDPDVEDDSSTLRKEMLTADSAKRAFRDMYRDLKMLQNYGILNYTAFVKIFKKHDKSTGLSTGKNMMKMLERFKPTFVETPECLALMDQIEILVARAYFSGNRMLALSELMLKHHKISSWEMMHIGFRIGVVLMLLCWVIWDVTVDTKRETLGPREQAQMEDTLRIFRGCGFFVLGFWLWTLCVFVWTTNSINYIYLFEFDPRRALLWEESLSKATTATIAYLFLLLSYVKITLGELGKEAVWAAQVFPFVLFLYMISLLLFPLEQTQVVLTAVGKIFRAPFHEVTFFQSFAADIFTSLARPFVDLSFALCFFFTGEWHRVFEASEPVEDAAWRKHRCATNETFNYTVVPLIVSAPLLIRIVQNFRRYHDTGKRWPHLLNALKYFVAEQIVLLGALHPRISTNSNAFSDADATNTAYHYAFIAALVGSSLFTYAWDVRMDWGIRTWRGSNLRGTYKEAVEEDCPRTPPAAAGADGVPAAAVTGTSGKLVKRPQVKNTERKMLLTQRWIYRTAIVLDLFMRFAWSLTLIPAKLFGAVNPTFVLGTTELCRRAMWCIIRVEFEHASNEHEYRRVEHVPSLFEQQDETRRENTSYSKYSVFTELALFSAIVVFFFGLTFATSEASGV